MPTLHDTTVMTKKVGLWAGLGIGGIFLIIFLFRVGVGLKEFFVPTGPPPPTTTYGKLPAVTFPANVTSEKLTYALDTISGFLPTFSDKLAVFPVAKRSPSLLDLQRARQRVAAVGFTGPERKIDETRYSWNEATSLNKTITMDVISSHFMMTSQYGTYPPILESQNIPDENGSSRIARGYLEDMELLPEDIDINKSKPILYSLRNGVLVPATSLSSTQVIRVDLYQKDKDDIPMYYPRPPYSTINFLIVGDTIDPVVEAQFFHQDIAETGETYPIKTADQAFEELRNGKGYIASFFGTSTTVKIKDVTLGYYISDRPQEYLMPIIVFHGDNDFIAYVSAVQNTWIK